MARVCPHCHEELPDPTAAELAELLGGLELAAVAPQAPLQGIGRWVETEDGPAFSVDAGAVQAAQQARQREHAEERRRR